MFWESDRLKNTVEGKELAGNMDFKVPGGGQTTVLLGLY